MMFVSVISTSAFADYNHQTQRTWKGASQNEKIVAALRKNIENMYGSLAVDNAVFSSLKSIDSIITDLVDEMLKDYGSNTLGLNTPSSTLNDAIVAGLRSTIGGEITDYLDKHKGDYYDYDSLGNKVFNPSKYAGVYAKAASGALTSKKAVAGIQAYMLFAAQRSVFNNIALQAGDLYNEMLGWGHMDDYGFVDDGFGTGTAATAAAIRGWHVPGSDTDGAHVLNGVLHNITAAYQETLSALGQLGVDLNDDGAFGLGFNGLVNTVDGTVETSTASENETVVTPRKNSGTVNVDGAWFLPDADAEIAWETYEGRSETDYIDNNPNFFPWFMGDGTVDVVTTNPGLVFGS
jgi:hypothetical protein